MMADSTIERARVLAGLQEKLEEKSKEYAGVERRSVVRREWPSLTNEEYTGVTPAEKGAISETFAVDMINAKPNVTVTFPRCPDSVDMVNSPPHYQIMPGVEVIDVRKGLMDKIPSNVPFSQADDWSRSWEYITRMWGKNGLEDAKKCRFYLNRLIESMESEL